MSIMSNIQWSYDGTTPDEVMRDHSFDPDMFESDMEPIFQTSVQVDRIMVKVHKESSKNHFRIHLEVVGPDINVFEETQGNPAEAVDKAIKIAIRELREYKDKHGHS